MSFDLSEFHERWRTEVIEKWVDRLMTDVGDQYATQPRADLMDTVTEAFDANYDVIIHDDYRPIDQFIRKITRMRLEAGFLLSDVQKAFELYRDIVIPLLAEETVMDEFRDSLRRINACLSYTIHRFSDHFQALHEKEILEHNRRLEEEVRARTAQFREAERMAYIGQITTSLSHEIRNPLSAVKLNLQVLGKNSRIRGNDRRRIDISVREVMEMDPGSNTYLQFL